MVETESEKLRSLANSYLIGNARITANRIILDLAGYAKVGQYDSFVRISDYSEQQINTLFQKYQILSEDFKKMVVNLLLSEGFFVKETHGESLMVYWYYQADMAAIEKFVLVWCINNIKCDITHKCPYYQDILFDEAYMYFMNKNVVPSINSPLSDIETRFLADFKKDFPRFLSEYMLELMKRNEEL